MSDEYLDEFDEHLASLQIIANSIAESYKDEVPKCGRPATIAFKQIKEIDHEIAVYIAKNQTMNLPGSILKRGAAKLAKKLQEKNKLRVKQISDLLAEDLNACYGFIVNWDE